MSGQKKLVLIILGIVLVGVFGAYIKAVWNDLPMDAHARANASGNFLNTSQGKVHYQIYGEKAAPTIVMVHGFSTPNFIYKQNATALAAAGFKVVTFDHLGRGWSDRPSMKYDDEFYERELLDILDGLELTEPVGLVGLSMGGLTTSYFTGRHPDRVKALFLFVPVGFDLNPDPDSMSVKALKAPILGDWVWRVFGEDILLGDPQYNELKLKFPNRLQGDVTKQMQYKGYLQSLLSTYRHMQMHDRAEVYRTLQTKNIPVTAIFGTADTTVLPTSLDKFNETIPDAKTVMIEGGGHGLNYQRHEQTNEYLISFFKAHLKK